MLFSVYMATQSITFCVPHAEVFAAARGAAASIFELLDREPKIDSLQTGGISPRRVIGDISLEDIYFNYPSRPEVKVRKILTKEINFHLEITYVKCFPRTGTQWFLTPHQVWRMCGASWILRLRQVYDTTTLAEAL